MFTLYPKRTILCFSLFVGQAFLYNAFFFTYGDTLTTFLGVKQTGWYLAVFAASNFVGALALSHLFDTIGRVQMISFTYIVSGVLLAGTGLFLGSVTATTLTLMGAIIFFFASAGASAAYLTASEIFPMETRALCIAFFYAIGTAAGGISGPLLFGALIDNASESGDITGIAIGYFIGAALMIAGGVVEAFLGVRAEGQSLESHRPAAHRGGRRRRRVVRRRAREVDRARLSRRRHHGEKGDADADAPTEGVDRGAARPAGDSRDGPDRPRPAGGRAAGRAAARGGRRGGVLGAGPVRPGARPLHRGRPGLPDRGGGAHRQLAQSPSRTRRSQTPSRSGSKVNGAW